MKIIKLMEAANLENLDNWYLVKTGSKKPVTPRTNTNNISIRGINSEGNTVTTPRIVKYVYIDNGYMVTVQGGAGYYIDVEAAHKEYAEMMKRYIATAVLDKAV